jgi:hypothetical protein
MGLGRGGPAEGPARVFEMRVFTSLYLPLLGTPETSARLPAHDESRGVFGSFSARAEAWAKARRGGARSEQGMDRLHQSSRADR